MSTVQTSGVPERFSGGRSGPRYFVRLPRVDRAEATEDGDRGEELGAEPLALFFGHPRPAQREVPFGWIERGEIVVVHTRLRW
jgi:hypothetical protein